MEENTDCRGINCLGFLGINEQGLNFNSEINQRYD